MLRCADSNIIDQLVLGSIGGKCQIQSKLRAQVGANASGSVTIIAFGGFEDLQQPTDQRRVRELHTENPVHAGFGSCHVGFLEVKRGILHIHKIIDQG